MEKKKRIRASLFAYAYEIMHDSLVSDAEYDALCREIDVSIDTDNLLLDKFFREEFSPDTGMWIYKHPQISGIMTIYQRITGKTAQWFFKPEEKQLVDTKQGNTPFRTHSENMIYLASLGFRVIPHFYEGFKFEFDKDFFTVTRQADGEQRVISYKDWFAK